MKRIAPVIAVALFTLALLAYAFSSPHTVRADSEQIVTTLYPGWNLIGWVDVEAPVGDLFETLPSLKSVYAYESAEQRWLSATAEGGDLQMLTPGMGLWLRMRDGAPFEWQRVRGAYVNSSMLTAGRNVIAWQALDAVPAAVGLRQIRNAATLVLKWDAQTQRWHTAALRLPHSLWTLTEFNHGDAIYVDAEQPVEWRQLTGESPRVTFIGDVSEEQRRETLEELEFIRETFATTFGGVVSGLNIFVFDDGETFSEWSQSVRGHFPVGCGDASPKHITYPLSCGASTLAHEYFHALQEYSGHQGARAPFVWMDEGGATLAEWVYQDAAGQREFNSELQGALARIRTVDANLTDPSSLTMRYAGGAVALALLTQRVGTPALLRYIRSAYPPAGDSAPEEVFEDIFGISLDNFYRDFEAARANGIERFGQLSGRATTLVTSESPYRLEVAIEGPDGSSLDDPANVSFLYIFGSVAFDGLMSIPASAGSYRLYKIEVGLCSIGWTMVGGQAREPLTVYDRWPAEAHRIRLSSLGCDSKITGIVRGPDGSPLRTRELRVWIEAYSGSDNWVGRTRKIEPTEDGRFEMPVVAGRYSIGVSPIETDGARFGWYAPSGLTRQPSERHIFDVPSGGVVEIDITLPYGRRVRIAGLVRGPDGRTVAGVTVDPHGSFPMGDESLGWIGWSEVSGQAGKFAVPFTGTHVTLELSAGECVLGTYGPGGFRPAGQAARYFEVNDEDITDIVIELPHTTCE